MQFTAHAFTLNAVAIVHSPRREPTDDFWGGLRSSIVFDPERFIPESLAELETFSHIEVVFVFHLYREEDAETRSRRPRSRDDWPKAGIFAQRNKHRPNRLGISRARVLRVAGQSLEVEGLDVVNGTPVLDVKPWFAEFGPRGTVLQPAARVMNLCHYYR